MMIIIKLHNAMTMTTIQYPTAARTPMMLTTGNDDNDDDGDDDHNLQMMMMMMMISQMMMVMMMTQMIMMMMISQMMMMMMMDDDDLANDENHDDLEEIVTSALEWERKFVHEQQANQLYQFSVDLNYYNLDLSFTTYSLTNFSGHYFLTQDT